MTLDEIGQQLADLHRDLIRSHPPILMTTKECAAFMSVTEETLFRWRKDGFGPPYSQPNVRVIRYNRDDVVAWMQEHRP